MSNNSIANKLNYFELPTQQKRLRHLRGVAGRNITNAEKPINDDVSNIETHFTLHYNEFENSKAFYKSEKTKGTLNPTWRSFNLTHLPVDELDLSSSSYVVRIWQSMKEKEKLLIEWDVDLKGLAYLGQKLQRDGRSIKPNTLIFNMFDGYFGVPDVELPSDPNKARMLIDVASMRPSYDIGSLTRINTIQLAIRQTHASTKKVRKNIEEKLSQSQILAKKKAEQEMYILRVNQLRSDLQWRTVQLQAEKEAYETLKANSHQRDVATKMKFESLEKDKGRLEDKKKGYFEIREELIKCGAQLVMRRKQLISELAFIYPINEIRDGVYTVCGVRLPNSEDFAGHDELMIAVALGYTCHLVQMISHFLDVPLRYPMEYRGSRSIIRDHILDKLADKERVFPLYSKGKERFQFNYGVYLLNKNIAQLRYYCGLGTTDLRLTLPNLKSLMELRLGVKFDAANSPLTLVSGHIPANFGNNQKAQPIGTESTNVKTSNGGQHNNPSQPEDNVEQFEELLSKAKFGEKSSNHRQQGEAICDNKTETKGVKIGNSSKTKGEHLDEEELFKGSPDSFFEIKIPASKDLLHLEGASDSEARSEAGDLCIETAEEATASLNNTEAAELRSVSVNSVKKFESENLDPNVLPNLDPTLAKTDFRTKSTLDNVMNCEDIDASSTEDNVNATYGSNFKTWPREPSNQENTDSISSKSDHSSPIRTLDPSGNDQSGAKTEPTEPHEFTFKSFKTCAMGKGSAYEARPFASYNNVDKKNNVGTRHKHQGVFDEVLMETQEQVDRVSEKTIGHAPRDPFGSGENELENRTQALSQTTSSFKLTGSKRSDTIT